MNPLDLFRMRNLNIGNPSPISDDPRTGGITGRGGFIDPNNPLNIQNQDPNPFGGIFKPQPMQTIPDASDPFDPLAKMKELYNPEHNYSDAYMEAIKNMPQREKPGKMQRVVAALAGLKGGPEAADKVLDAPYNQARQDWIDKIKALEPGMQYERFSNANERTLANEMVGRQIQDRRADIAAGESKRKSEADKAKEEGAAADREIRKARAGAYIYKQNHPNYNVQTDDEGYLVGINPQTAKAEYITDSEGNFIHSSKLPEQDRLDAIKNTRLAAIHAQGAEARQTEGVKEGARQADIKERGAQARETKTGGKEGETVVTETTSQLIDPKTGKPTAKKVVTQKKGPEAKVVKHSVQYTGKDGKLHIALVPKEKVAEAVQHGGKDLGEVK